MQLKEKDIQLHEFNDMLKKELELNKNNQFLFKDKPQDVNEEHFTELETKLIDIEKQINVKKSKECIIEMHDITSDEQKELKIAVNKNEKHRWNNGRRKDEKRNIEGLTISEQKKLDNITSVKELKSKGLSFTAIAEQLSIRRRTAMKYCGIQKKVKEYNKKQKN